MLGVVEEDEPLEPPAELNEDDMTGEKLLGDLVLGELDEDEPTDFPVELTVEIGEEKEEDSDLDEGVGLDVVEPDRSVLELIV